MSRLATSTKARSAKGTPLAFPSPCQGWTKVPTDRTKRGDEGVPRLMLDHLGSRRIDLATSASPLRSR